VKQKHFEVNIILIIMSYGNLNEMKFIHRARRLHVFVPTTHLCRNVKTKRKGLEEHVIPLQAKYSEQYCGGG